MLTSMMCVAMDHGLDILLTKLGVSSPLSTQHSLPLCIPEQTTNIVGDFLPLCRWFQCMRWGMDVVMIETAWSLWLHWLKIGMRQD